MPDNHSIKSTKYDIFLKQARRAPNGETNRGNFDNLSARHSHLAAADWEAHQPRKESNKQPLSTSDDKPPPYFQLISLPFQVNINKIWG